MWRQNLESIVMEATEMEPSPNNMNKQVGKNQLSLRSLSLGPSISLHFYYPHGATSHKATFFMFTAAKTSNLTQHKPAGLCSGDLFPVRYELGFYIPEDVILHSHCRENLKSSGVGCLGTEFFSEEDRLFSIASASHRRRLGQGICYTGRTNTHFVSFLFYFILFIEILGNPELYYN
jgi:hypothetical protein